MSRTAYPTDAEVLTFVTGTGIELPSGYVATGYAAAGSSEFERRTGRVPFLRDGSDVVRTFDPPGDKPSPGGSSTIYGGRRALPLHAGLVSVTSVVATGATLSASQYRLLPQNAVAMKRPYEMIEFAYPIWGAAGSVVITGKWGWSADIPEDAFQAILRLAAIMFVGDLATAISGDPIEQKELEESERMSIELIGKWTAPWSDWADRVISRYKLTTVGIG